MDYRAAVEALSLGYGLWVMGYRGAVEAFLILFYCKLITVIKFCYNVP